LEVRPEGAQLSRIAALATRAGVDSAIPLREMHEQFCLFTHADHYRHGDGGVLSEPAGFGQEKLFQLLDRRVGFQEWRRSRRPGA